MRLPSRPPKLLQNFFRQCYWSFPNTKNKIYLTFDDGPTPEVLPFILKTLNEYNVKATFFCVGDNLKKYPHLVTEILSRKHVIGNHSQNHLSGWKTNNQAYFKNVEDCSSLHQTNLFRPPYGRIKKSQANYLSKKYKIVMWDVLSYDYNKTVLPEVCYRNVIDNTKSGSVIVFHDNLKAYKNLQYALPNSIAFLLNKGFVFDVIS